MRPAAHALVRALARAAAIAAGFQAVLVLVAGRACADVTHVVQRGQPLEVIAQKYHVTIRAICDANHLKKGEPLKPGQSLVIPGVDAPPSRDGSVGVAPSRMPEGREESQGPRGLDRDVVNAVRLDEQFRIRLNDGRGKIPGASLKVFERLMRQGESTHPPDTRLVALIGVVSNHFNGRTLEVVSGFRPFTTTQYTLHSRHNEGKALDFRVRGIPNEVLRDFCRTLPNTGCGYYPNSTFVHLDVRDRSATWVDLARPGEPPRYERPDRPDAPADEGTSDVTTDSH
ncbi:MAG TPA: DUF882 domain-containing protein [Polyangiaceae bacterium]|jgi:uncharacterized protein YcbK (DUF882 family)|nr:DUF882 domain-containing protein [Polyangiaceae bacterium]